MKKILFIAFLLMPCSSWAYYYYLGPFVETTENEMSVRRLPLGAKASIDLSCSNVPNMAFIVSGNTLLPPYVYLGEGDMYSIPSDSKTENAWKDAYGYKPKGDTVADLLFDQLTEGADPDRITGPKPLIPTQDGTLNLSLQGHPKKKVKFTWGDKYTNKIKKVIQRDLNKIRDGAQSGKTKNPKTNQMDTTYHRVIAQGYLDKYKAQWSDIKPSEWSKGETPLPRATVITDDFDGGNSVNLGQDLSWHDTFGDVQNNTNMAYQPGTQYYGFAIAESNLSTDDMYAQVVFPDGYGADNIHVGARCNFSITQDWYMGGYYIYAGHFLEKVVSSSVSSLVTDSDTSDTLPLTLKIVVDGSDLTLYANGVEKLSTTDTDLTGQTQGGIGMFNYYGWGDDFEAGDYTGSSPSVTVHERRRVVLAQ